MRTLLTILGSVFAFTPDANANAPSLDGSWILQSTTRNGNTSQLAQGNTVLLKIRGPKGEIILTPGHDGVVESLIKSLCTKLYGVGKIVYQPKNTQAVFEVADVKGDDSQSFCPATSVLGQLAGKDVADQLEKRSLKFNIQYKKAGSQLTVTTLYKKEPVSLFFKKQ